MKKIITLVLLVILVSCKKPEIKPSEPPKEDNFSCSATNNNSFVGTYVSSEGDTMTMKYIACECNDFNIVKYSLSGLKKVYANRGKCDLEDRDFIAIINEKNQSYEKGECQMQNKGNSVYILKLPKESDILIGFKKIK